MVSPFPLRVSAAEVRRRGNRIVGPVDLTLAAGETTVVLGPNGAGKTTFLRALHGVERLSAGAAEWAVPRAEADLAQAFVFQQPILLRRSALDNVAYPLRLRGTRRTPARETARAALARVGLSDAADRPAHRLSGGERQKMALARALVTRPAALFLDEPTASLDGRSTREIEAILTDARAGGTTLVMATHDLGQARRMADRVLFLYRGRVHEDAAADAFFDAPATAEAHAFLQGDIVE